MAAARSHLRALLCPAAAPPRHPREPQGSARDRGRLRGRGEESGRDAQHWNSERPKKE